MVGPLVIAKILPKFALYIFTLMALSALCSTLDSALCAVSSLGSIDIYKRYFNPNSSDKKLCQIARYSMIAIALLGTGIALLEPSMLWTFLVTGCITGSLFFPAIFALYAKKLRSSELFWGVALSLIISIPFSIYANVHGNQQLIVFASLSSVAIGLLFCLLSRKLHEGKDRALSKSSGRIAID